MADTWGFGFDEDSLFNQNIFQDDSNFYEFLGFGGYSGDNVKSERVFDDPTDELFIEEAMDTQVDEQDVHNSKANHPEPKKDGNKQVLSQSLLSILKQPPSEVRTRTPGEKRSFKVKVRASSFERGTEVGVELFYAPDRGHPNYELVEKQTILGGSKSVGVDSEGVASFDLCMWEGSRKHNEREFALRFFLVGKVEKEKDLRNARFSVLSDSFYTYSHQRVLAKRKEISVRTLNQGWGFGGEQMHIVGKGFLDSPSLNVMIETRDGHKVFASAVEFHSDSVVFFQLPHNPSPFLGDLEANVLVTNDGRNFSSPLKFVYMDNRRLK